MTRTRQQPRTRAGWSSPTVPSTSCWPNRSSYDVLAVGDYYARRGSLAIRALELGRHVLLDKPICIDLAELDRIAALSRGPGHAGGGLHARQPRQRQPAAVADTAGRGGDRNRAHGHVSGPAPAESRPASRLVLRAGQARRHHQRHRHPRLRRAAVAARPRAAPAGGGALLERAPAAASDTSRWRRR